MTGKPHDSPQQSAEQGMDALLRRSLSTAVPGAECPAPETIAAYSERSLDRDEVRSLESHFATCAHCREMLAVLDRSVPQDAPQQTERKHAGWTWLWDWRWLGPAAAAFALAGVWFVRHEAATQLARETRELPILAMTRSRELQPDVPMANSATAPPPAAESSAPPPAQPEPAEKKSADAKRKADARDSAQVQQLRAEVDRLESTLKKEESATNDSTAEAAHSARAPQANAAPAPAPAAPPSAAPKTRAALASPSAQRFAAAQAPQSAPLNTIIRTPDANVLWRLVAGGFLEHSTDGGTTWQQQTLPPNSGAATGAAGVANVRIAAGSAPTAEVCWLVGNAGLILLTKDGETWAKIWPPIVADFASVSATSAQDATVTAADGRKFATHDGGGSWTPVQ